MTSSVMRALRLAAFLCCLPTTAFAQRSLHWDRLQVTAHLDAGGTLQVVETQTMVFTGDWNGGERTFNIRPRQKLIFRRNLSGQRHRVAAADGRREPGQRRRLRMDRQQDASLAQPSADRSTLQQHARFATSCGTT